MPKLWDNEEIELLTACIEAGWKHKEIATELDRSLDSIKNKATKLGIATRSYWTDKDIEILKTCLNNKWIHKDIAIKLNRSIGSIHKKAGLLELISNAEITLSDKQISKKLKNKQIKIIGKYKNTKTPIEFKCLKCSYIWKVSPASIFSGTACPVCAKSGFKEDKPAATYCIYFKELDLYKIGITNNYKVRLKYFGYKPEIIFIREFELGKDARTLETQWLENIKEHLINTGKLKSGNTETFRYAD